MNKKFLSAILFGALMVTATGTFVSCKDYDDDIKDLQDKVSKLATKEDMTSQIATLQTALTAAAKDASDAITKATAAETAAKAAGDDAAAAKAAAEKAAADAKTEAIKAVQGELDALKKEVAESTEAALKDMADKVDAATKKVEDIVGKIADMVTSVELVASYSAANNLYSNNLNMMTVLEKDKVFEKDINNAISFKKGTQVQTGESFIVRVSPTNAILTPEMISLVNSKGENLDDFLTVTKVEQFKGLLYGQSSRASGKNGLWSVSVALKSYDKDKFDAVTKTKVAENDYRKVLFAVEVNNTLSTAATREVLSSYDLSIDKQDYTQAKDLYFFVNDEHVVNINNRYSTNSKSLKDKTVTLYKELIWDVTKTNIPTTDPITKGSDVNVTSGDNRDAKDLYPAIQGEPITISLTTSGNSSADYEAPSNIRAMYVVLDKANALESAPSELNAWTSYSYTGLNTVVEGTSTQITINGTNVIDDIIGFRVFAVNYDGTLVDPDGKAFYVKLGKAGEDWNAINTTIVPQNVNITAVTGSKSNAIATTLTQLTGISKATWNTDKIGNNSAVFNAYFVDKNDKILYTTSDVNGFSTIKNADNASKFDFNKITKIYTMPTINDWKQYEDDKAYNGTLTIYNADNFVLATIKVTMTKVLPTGLPEGFSVKTNQVKDGIYNCYLVPKKAAADPAATWTASEAEYGTMLMTDVFNFGKNNTESQKYAPNYIVTFAESTKDADGKLIAVTPAGNGSLAVAKSYINNEMKHATSVDYNYGQISSKTIDGKYVDYKINATTFQTIYNCVYNSTYSWRWATLTDLNVKTLPYKTTLTYGTNSYETTVPTADAFAKYIKGVSARDGLYSCFLSAPYSSSLKIKDAHLVSDANKQVDEYFTVNFEKDGNAIYGFTAAKVSDTTNPEGPVASTLIITVYDMYNHEFDITVPMTVNKR